MRTEGPFKAKKVGIAYIAECNLKVINLVVPAEHVLVAIMGESKIFTCKAVPVVYEALSLGSSGIGVTSPLASTGGNSFVAEGRTTFR